MSMTPAKKGFTLRGLMGENRPTLWLAPLLAVVTLFYFYPAIEVLRYSLTNASLLKPNYQYTLSTFAHVLGDPVLYQVIKTTAIFVIASIVSQIILGLIIALAVNRASKRRLPGRTFIRSLVLSAWVMPGVVIGIVWSIVLNDADYGLANLLLGSVGLGSVSWLSTPSMALFSVILANVWRGTAFSMILQYAGLQSIPDELYEAAQVDGAGSVSSFFYITLPQLRPIFMINIILITISTLNTFDMILPLTGGGPGQATEVLSLRTYNVIFQDYSLSQGGVLAVIMLLIALVLTLFYRRLLRSEGTL